MNEEEAWVEFTVQDFNHCLLRYGIKFILDKLPRETYAELDKYFTSTHPRGSQEICKLLQC